ncbi:MAG: hypothetical protein AAFQ95_15790 [Cyanobacteria bacterium J06621_3]
MKQETSVRVTILNATGLDEVEHMDNMGVFLASPDQVYSGITDNAGTFQASVVRGDYSLSVADPVIAPSSGSIVTYLTDHTISVSDSSRIDVQVEIDSREVASDKDIPSKIKTAVFVREIL